MSRETLSPLTPPPQPLFVVLSGLSGAGKDAVLAGLRLTDLSLFISVSATTRPRRAGEKDGFDYHFISPTRFQELIDTGQLLEWANVYGNYYGIPKEPVRQALHNGKDVIVKIDVQGAATIKKILPQAVFIFMVTPYMEELEKRLKQRRTETSDDLELRLKTAAAELRQLPVFDYVVVNRPGEINQAVADIVAIIKAEKCRVAQRKLAI
jgi:guanylate kinase